MTNEQRLELRNQALLESVSSLTTEYEGKVADLRVEITMLNHELHNAQEELSAAVEKLKAATEGTDEVSQEVPASDEG